MKPSSTPCSNAGRQTLKRSNPEPYRGLVTRRGSGWLSSGWCSRCFAATLSAFAYAHTTNGIVIGAYGP
jgi:hypothetical protein